MKRETEAQLRQQLKSKKDQAVKDGDSRQRVIRRGKIVSPITKQNLGDRLLCMYTSIDSLANKRDEFFYHVCETQPDIIGVTEVLPKHIKSEVLQQDMKTEGYDIFANVQGRGSVVYAKASLRAVELKLKLCNSAVWCNVRLRSQDSLLVGVVYRSPNSDEQFDCQLNNAIREVTSMNCSHVLIVGDFNYLDID